MLNTRITTPSTKKPFFSVIEPPTIPPSFAPVGRCVGRTRPGRHPLPTNNCLRPLSGQRGEKTRYLTPALAFLIKWQDDMRFAHNDWPHFRWRIPMFLEVNRGTKKSRRKNRRFCCADSLTTSRSAGSCEGFAVYQKWDQNPTCAVTSAVTNPEHLLSQQKNRGQAPERSSLWAEKRNSPSTSLRRRRPS